ncbi:type II secretion system F family protein [Clostridium lacusfryxellense]|uniref:type II secretion system F family protein n=1 Tax=Clostridium lacusfryxellense TaxID=205328 RepID=UPI001C0C55E5|nr:type II secretion system F family protein [Clostridium lacusfryxellense]MBU3112339.1 type II secretion system F family protein [Clostridium lacusfryxellense]
MALFKKKIKIEPKHYLFPDAKVYFEYNLSIKEKILYFLIAFCVGSIVGYIFYSKIVIAIIAGLVAGYAFIPIRRKQIINNQIKKLRIQFRDLLETLSTSISAGKNIIDSFIASYDDLKGQYSESADMVLEVKNIVSGVNNNVNIEDLLLDLAERSGVEDIISFADVFEICYRKGGNIKEIIKNTYEIIDDKMQIDMEIETMVTSAKTEQKMMLVMPILFVFIMKSMGGGLSGQGTPISIVTTTIALCLFALAYFVGTKIMAIKL